MTDINWNPITPLRPDVAWGSQMHAGFYFNLFGNFTDAVEGIKIPFGEQFPNQTVSYCLTYATGHQRS